MFFNKTERKKRHPYRMLAMLTFTAAGVISVANSVMEFVKDKAKGMTSCVKKMMKD